MPGRKDKISEKTVGRLSVYRRVLSKLCQENRLAHLYSHALAEMAGATPAQVRRDIMAVGYTGSPIHGYEARQLLEHIDSFLNPGEPQRVALAGVGNLGRAVLAYFSGRRPSLEMVAAFDNDPHRYGRVIAGCRTYNTVDMPAILSERRVSLGIVAVPASAAQSVVDVMLAAGVTGILNFAPVSLRTPPGVYVEDIDLMMALEKVAYFARGT